MGRKPLSYVDAATLLGGDSRAFAALSRIAGAGLSIASAGSSTALSLIGLKDEVERLGQDAVVTLRNRVKKLNRFKRSELVEAAHAVLVVSAFFTALDDLSKDLRTALDSASLELTRAEETALATESGSGPGPSRLADLARELTAADVIPGLGAGWAEKGSDLKAYYHRLAAAVGRFAPGTAVWDERDETTRGRWFAAISTELPGRALTRYEELLAQLAGEFPEFAFWAHRVGVQTILDEVQGARRDHAELGDTLRTLAELMRLAAQGTDPGAVRSSLAAMYRSQLDKPIAASGAAADGVRFPPLRELYVNPSCRKLPRLGAFAGGEPVSELSWQAVLPDRDLWTLVLEHLISTQATDVPLVLLGQPGSGKSSFTQMLAAELDPRDYLVVRVELRGVPWDMDIQQQVEAGLLALTGRTLPWPELAGNAGSAQPVIVLDGFDELLQASGVSHFDYLERVQAFQEREADLGRPVAVLVTSRTAVANQVRYPDGTTVVRIEEFDDDQVSRWLATWNAANPARQLPVQMALEQGELARQPLLLLLLALVHSGGGGLFPGISQAQLYQRLFTSLVERDVAKTSSRLSDQDQRRAAGHDLNLLSMVAFAMFNRGRQMVSEKDLVADFTALELWKQPSGQPGERAVALTIAQRLAGRFFFRLFMQRDQAMHGQQTTFSTYEFLHASFGEFLVARWVVAELGRLAEQARRAADDLYRPPTNDGLLHALLSVAVLSGREQRVLDFMSELLASVDTDRLAEMRTLATALFRDCLWSRRNDAHPQYQPIAQTGPARYAAYSANLLLVVLVISEAGIASGYEGQAELTLAELYPDVPAPDTTRERLGRFHAVTGLWHAQLSTSDWNGLLDVVRVASITAPDAAGTADNSGLQIIRWSPIDDHEAVAGRTLLPDLGPGGSPSPEFRVWPGDPAGRALRESALLGLRGYQDACAALLPYLDVLGVSAGARQLQLGGRAADMLTILLNPTPGMSPEEHAGVYARLLDYPLGVRQARLLLDRLREDVSSLLPASLIQIVVNGGYLAWTNINAYLDVLVHLHATAAPRAPKKRSVLVVSTRFDPRDEMDPRDLLDQRPLGVLSLRKQRVSVDPQDPRDLSEFLDTVLLSGNPRLPSSAGHRSLAIQVGEIDRMLFRYTDIWRGLLVLQDTLDLPQMPDPRVLGELLTPAEKFVKGSSVAEVAVWTGMAQRGLPVKAPRRLANREQAEILRRIAPDFVARTRQLAAERSYTDPLRQALCRSSRRYAAPAGVMPPARACAPASRR